MEPYARRAFYYETDQMGIVHHSNYIRWMEEARLDLMRQAGLDYRTMEQAGIIMPVTSVECRYKISGHYDEPVFITAIPTEYNGVRAAFRYEIRGEDGRLMAEGSSGHCFLDTETRCPLNLKRRLPEYSAQFEKVVVKPEVK